MSINYFRKYYSSDELSGAEFIITADNFEYYLLLYIDNELSDTLKNKFELFIAENPLYKNELEQLQRLKLTTDQISIDKSSLFRNTIITNKNAEDYYLQYIDGELTNEETNLLFQFLDTNPSIKQKLSTLSHTKLFAEEVSFNHSLLYKVNNSLFEAGLNWSELLCLYLDNELTPEQRNFVETELSQNNNLQKEFALLKNTKAINESFVYPNKKALYQHSSKERKLIPFWIRYVAAACFLGFIIVQFINKPVSEIQSIQVPIAKAGVPGFDKNTISIPIYNNLLSLANEKINSKNNTQISSAKNKPVISVVNNQLNKNEDVTKLKTPRNTDNNVVIANDLNPEDVLVSADKITTRSLKEIFISEKALPAINSLPNANELVLNTQESYLQNEAEVTIFDIDANKIDQKGRTKKVGQKLNQFFTSSVKRLADKSITIGGYEIAIAK